MTFPSFSGASYQATIPSRRPEAITGKVYDSSFLNNLITLLNEKNQTKQVSTITVDTAADNTTYTVSVNGETVTVNSGTSATTTTIATAIKEAINEDYPLARAACIATSSTNVVTLTGLNPGRSFTVTDSDANLTTATGTAAATADTIAFGRAMMGTGFATNAANEKGALPKSTYLTAQVDTLTITYVASAEYHVGVLLNGYNYKVQCSADTSATVTAAAIVTALNALLPANTVLVSSSSGVITFTAEIAGLDFNIEFGASNDGASIPTFTPTTTKSYLTSLEIALKGISIAALDEENLTVEGNDVVYPANAMVKALQKGKIWVDFPAATSLTYNSAVYVETSGSNAGKLYNDSSSTRVKLPLSKARWLRKSENEALALVQINFEGA